MQNWFQNQWYKIRHFQMGCLPLFIIFAVSGFLAQFGEGANIFVQILLFPFALLSPIVFIYGLLQWNVNIKRGKEGLPSELQQRIERLDKYSPSDKCGPFIGTTGINKEGFNKKDEVSPYRYGGNTHLITIAQNRAGKGATSIISTLLDNKNAHFVIDPKGENALNTIGYRTQNMGHDVKVLDPFNESKVSNATYNPLSEINPDDAETECQQLAASLIRQEDGKESFWSDMATSLLSAAILHVVSSDMYSEEDKHLPFVYDKLLLDRETFVQEMAMNSAFPSIQHAVAEILQCEEKVTQSVYSTIRGNLSSFLNDAKIRKSLETSSFSMYSLMEGLTDIYVVLPLDKIDTFSRWLRLITTSAIQKLLRTPPRNINRNNSFIYLLLDEFGNFGYMKILENAFTTATGYRVLLWPFLQDLSQLEKDYPKSWRSIIGQAGLIEVFGIGEIKTAEYISSMIGQTDVVTETVSISHDNKESRTTGKKTTNILRPDEIKNLRNDTKLVLRQGRKTALIGKIAYFDDIELRPRWLEGLRWTIDNYPETEPILRQKYPYIFKE